MSDEREPHGSHEPDAPFDVDGTFVGEPNAATTPRYCRNCKAEVVPEGKGQCPRCGKFLRLNFVSRRHPINKLHVEVLEAELVADYRPTSMILRSTCQHLAGTLERLEVVRAGSAEWQRLVQIAQMLAQTLADARLTRNSDQEPLTPATMREKLSLLSRLLDNVEARQGDAPAATLAPVSALVETPAEPPAPAERIAERCPYGCGTLERCATLKADDLDTWLVIHGRDPEAAKIWTHERPPS